MISTGMVLAVVGIVFVICAACALLARWFDRPDCDHKWKEAREILGGGIVWKCGCGKEVICPRGYPPR